MRLRCFLPLTPKGFFLMTLTVGWLLVPDRLIYQDFPTAISQKEKMSNERQFSR